MSTPDHLPQNTIGLSRYAVKPHAVSSLSARLGFLDRPRLPLAASSAANQPSAVRRAALEAHPGLAQKTARHATIATTMNTYTSIDDGPKEQATDRPLDVLFSRVGPSGGQRRPETFPA